MSTYTTTDAATAVLLVLGALIVLPLLTMGAGMMGGAGGMMGGSGVGGWGWLGGPLQIGLLLVLLGGGYFLVRQATGTGTSRTVAEEELRLAYARGDLTEEEFEERRTKLGGE
ncbi:MAG: SHOCT domain-containing protein [Halobacteriales archaeon]